jgi:hypothetical protein
MPHESASQMIAPPSQASGPSVAGQNQYRSGESRESFIQSVQQSRVVRACVNAVVTNRAQLAALLVQYRLGLVTSAKEFESSRDFIASSYVVYLDHGQTREPLSAFCARYPDFLPHAQVVAQSLRAAA